jgi:Flp pilus assembly protein TadG
MSNVLRAHSGQALVETALVLPVLLVLLLGIITYGLYINAVDTVQQAVRVGVRAASIGDTLGCPGDSAIAQLAAGDTPTVYGLVDDQINTNRWISQNADLPVVSYAAIVGDNTDAEQNTVLMTVALAYHPVVPIPGLLPSTVEISQTYQMMVQNPQPADGLTTQEPTGTPYDETSTWTSPAPPTTNTLYLIQPGGCTS